MVGTVVGTVVGTGWALRGHWQEGVMWYQVISVAIVVQAPDNCLASASSPVVIVSILMSELPPRKRMRTKTPPLVAYGLQAQEGLPKELFTETSDAKNQVYLVTCSHPVQTHSASGIALRAPCSYDHQALLHALQDACQNPAYDRGNQARSFGGVRLFRCLVAAEYHNGDAAGAKHRHYHIALQAFRDRKSVV